MTTINSKINVQSPQAADQALIAGFQKYASTIPASLLIGGTRS
jgi:hypothetical protein